MSYSWENFLDEPVWLPLLMVHILPSIVVQSHLFVIMLALLHTQLECIHLREVYMSLL